MSNKSFFSITIFFGYSIFMYFMHIVLNQHWCYSAGGGQRNEKKNTRKSIEESTWIMA